MSPNFKDKATNVFLNSNLIHTNTDQELRMLDNNSGIQPVDLPGLLIQANTNQKRAEHLKLIVSAKRNNSQLYRVSFCALFHNSHLAYHLGPQVTGTYIPKVIPYREGAGRQTISDVLTIPFKATTTPSARRAYQKYPEMDCVRSGYFLPDPVAERFYLEDKTVHPIAIRLTNPVGYHACYLHNQVYRMERWQVDVSASYLG
ncbi:hypothetical protein [Larkinella arboricola]|nr:hypothetical protein [Larkinella arboricola]